MHCSIIIIIGGLSILNTLLAGCAAPQGEETDTSGSAVSSPVQACTAEQLAAAEKAYDETLAMAHKTLEDACAEGATSYDTHARAGLALAKCSAITEKFRDAAAEKLLATFDGAALASATVEGRLVVRDTNGRFVWRGVEKAIPHTSFYGMRPLEDGTKVSVRLGSGQSASYVSVDPDTLEQKNVKGTYALGKIDSSGAIGLSLTLEDGSEKSYAISQDVVSVDGQKVFAPIFTLTDKTSGDTFSTELGCEG